MRIVPLATQHGGAEFHSLLTKRKDPRNVPGLRHDVGSKRCESSSPFVRSTSRKQHLKLPSSYSSTKEHAAKATAWLRRRAMDEKLGELRRRLDQKTTEIESIVA